MIFREGERERKNMEKERKGKERKGKVEGEW
jgi:hypothetical protein